MKNRDFIIHVIKGYNYSCRIFSEIGVSLNCPMQIIVFLVLKCRRSMELLQDYYKALNCWSAIPILI